MTVQIGARAALQGAALAAVRVLYPPQCMACGAAVDVEGGLCPECWAETPFVSGLACDCCGVPLPGRSDHEELCDACLGGRAWSRGRAALRYGGAGKRIVLAMKHGDRPDLARWAGGWLARVGAPLIGPGTVLVPVPLHRRRLLARRYNQAALLAREVARRAGAACCPDLLVRGRDTGSQEGLGSAGRHANVDGAIRVHPRRSAEGRDVLLVDDVLTSGATMAACARACMEGGAARVDVLVLARVARDA